MQKGTTSKGMEANKNFDKWLSCGIQISGTFGLHHVCLEIWRKTIKNLKTFALAGTKFESIASLICSSYNQSTGKFACGNISFEYAEHFEEPLKHGTLRHIQESRQSSP
jgi:hypothetical protein